jgi:predicted peptidase
MGGQGTWDWATRSPGRFAAIVPICGRGNRSAVKLLAEKPIWVFHGAKDNSVSLEESEKMVQGLKKQGSDVKFTVYPEAGHDSWTATYDNPELYDWLLQQQLR